MRYHERHVLADGRLLEMRVSADRRWRLRYGRPGAWQVRYEDGARSARGRTRRYEFRSVEQLRYDFERDVAHALPEA